MRRRRRCTGCAGPILYPPPISFCANKIVPDGEKALGIKIQFETINANDIQARVTSSIQSGNGPDIIMALNNWPQLYATSLADVSDVTEEIGKAQGGYYDMVQDSWHLSGQVDRRAVGDWRRARLLPEILARAKPDIRNSR